MAWPQAAVTLWPLLTMDPPQATLSQMLHQYISSSADIGFIIADLHLATPSSPCPTQPPPFLFMAPRSHAACRDGGGPPPCPIPLPLPWPVILPSLPCPSPPMGCPSPPSTIKNTIFATREGGREGAHASPLHHCTYPSYCMVPACKQTSTTGQLALAEGGALQGSEAVIHSGAIRLGRQAVTHAPFAAPPQPSCTH